MGCDRYLTLFALVGLTACGGSGGGSGSEVATLLVPARQLPGNDNAIRQPRFNGSAVEFLDVQTQTVAGTIGVSIQVNGLPDNFRSFSDGSDTAFALVGFAPNDTMQTVSTVGERDLFRLDRLTPTILPTTSAGVVVYDGPYAAQYEAPQGDGTVDFGHMLGDLVLIVDFENAELAGRVENRRNSASAPAFEMKLRITSLEDDGTFVGNTEAGAFLSQPNNGSGLYRGIIGGTSGEDVAIGITAIHGNSIREVGTAIITGDPQINLN